MLLLTEKFSGTTGIETQLKNQFFQKKPSEKTDLFFAMMVLKREESGGRRFT
ncbi:hypothetical protein ACUIJQ_09035 [Levilactobacillus hammesii]